MVILQIGHVLEVFSGNLVVGGYEGSADVSPSGAAVYTIPIECPKGVNGMEPIVNLTYNSQGGHGTVGWKWTLFATSSITKAIATPYYDGKILPINSDNGADYLMLDGVRLISYSMDKSSNRLTLMKEYGSYDNIVRCGSNGNYYFEVFSTNGKKLTYRQLKEGAAFYNGNMGWYLTQVEDMYGNYMTYNYTVNATRDNIMSVLLQSIQYGGNLKNEAPHTCKVEFVYDSSLPCKVNYVIGGYKKEYYKLLSEIRTYAEDNLNTKYVLRYADDVHARKLLKGVKRYGNNDDYLKELTIDWVASSTNIKDYCESNIIQSSTNKLRTWFVCDFDSDGKMDLIAFSQYLVNGQRSLLECYRNISEPSGYVRFSYTTSIPVNLSGTLSCGGVMPCCFTSKERQDMLFPLLQNYNTLKIINLNQGKATDYLTHSLRTIHTGKMPLYSCSDFNKDGYADIVIVEREKYGTSYVCKIFWGSESASLSAYKGKTSEFSFPCDGVLKKMVLADENADGLVDIIIVSDKGYSILYNKGNEKKYDVCSFSCEAADYHTGMSCDDDNSTVFVSGDFNGDGVCDFIKSSVNDEHPCLYTGNGKGSFIKKSLTNLPKCVSGDFAIAADTDGDGVSEIMFVTNAGKKVCWYRSDYSNGVVLEQIHSSTNVNRAIGINDIAVGDVTGDGRMDFISAKYSLLDNGSFPYGLFYAMTTNSQDDDLVREIEDPMRKITFSYGSLIDDNVCIKRQSLKNSKNIMSLKAPMLVTKSIIEQACNSIELEKTYTYEDAIVQTTGKGFLGFLRMSVFDERNWVTTTVYNKYLEAPAMLYPVRIDKTLDKLIQSTSFSYHPVNSEDGTSFLPLKEKKEIDYLNETNCKTTYSDYKFGNPTVITTIYGDSTIQKVHHLDLLNTGEYNIFLPQQTVISYLKGYDSREIMSIVEYNNQFSPKKTIESAYKSKTTKYTYATNGNLTKQVVSANNCETRTTTYSYTKSGRFLSSVKDYDGTTTTYTIDEKYGRPTKKVEKVGGLSYSTTYNNYDGFNHCSNYVFSDGRVSTEKISYCSAFSTSVYCVESTLTGAPDMSCVYDADGHLIRKEENDVDGKKRMLFYTYDQFLGMVTYEYARMKGGTPSGNDYYAYYEYDELGRLTKIETPVGTTKYTYKGKKTIIKSPLGTCELLYNDARRLVSSTENGKSVIFTYDPMGNLSSSAARSSKGNYAVKMEYDDAGNRHLLNDPDVGIIMTDYDAYGREVIITTEKNVDIVSVYDNRGRLVEKSDGQNKTLFEYNNSNQLVKKICGIYSCEYSYDAYNRITKKNEIIDGNTFETKYEYAHAYGDATDITYPSGLKVSREYDDYGHLTSVSCNNKILWKPLKLDYQGRIAEEQLAGDVTQTYSYNKFNLLNNEKASQGTSILKNLSYSYSSGRLDKKTDAVSRFSETYKYDELNRLNQSIAVSESGNSFYDETCVYDDAGNMILIDADKWKELSYGENSLPPHQVSSISCQTPDETMAPRQIKFDSYRMIKQINQGNLRYEVDYNPSHRSCRSRLYRSDKLVRTKYYLGNYEKEVDKNGKSREIHYLCGGSGLAAIYVRTDGKDTLFAAVTDRQNSLTAVMDVATKKVERCAYEPWGIRSKDALRQTGGTTYKTARFLRGYCMHEHLPELGVIDMGGRMYDERTYQFLSPDPYLQNPALWLNHNRYAYCMQNPVMYTDPDGEWVHILVGAVMGGAINLAMNWDNTQGFWQGFTSFVIGAGAGASVAATFGASLGVFLGVSAASSAVTMATNNVIAQTGENFSGMSDVNWGNVGISAGLGMVTGFVSSASGYGINQLVGKFIFNGWNVNSPAVRGFLSGAIGGGGAGYASGFTMGMITTGDFKEARDAGFQGMWKGALWGGGSGLAGSAIWARQNGVNLWTGESKIPNYDLTPEIGDFAENVTLYRGTTGSEGNGKGIFMTDDLGYAQKYIRNGGHIESITIPKVTLDRMYFNQDMRILTGEQYLNYTNGHTEYFFSPNVKNQIINHMK